MKDDPSKTSSNQWEEIPIQSDEDWAMVPDPNSLQGGMSSPKVRIGDTDTTSPKSIDRNKTKARPRHKPQQGEFDTMVLHLAREEDLWRKEIICVKDICDSHHMPQWNLLIKTFPYPSDWDAYGINCPFDRVSDAIFLDNRVIVTCDRQLRAALRYFKNEGRVNLKGYVVEKRRIGDGESFRWVEDI